MFDQDEGRAMMEAARYGDLGDLQELHAAFGSGKTIDYKDQSRNTPLHFGKLRRSVFPWQALGQGSG